MATKKLVIMRGLPGSGKSTQARIFAETHIEMGGQSVAICSTDSYHMEGDKYVFKPDRLGEFHKRNQVRVEDLMSLPIELVIVDNTNITRKDMQPYMDSAKLMGYEVEEVLVGSEFLFAGMDTDHNKFLDYIARCTTRNTHGVPASAVERMARRFEE